MTDESGTISKARVWCLEALKCMKERGQAPTPDNYAIWYAYVAGTHPDLTYRIQRLNAEGRPFTAEDAADLRKQFFGSQSEKDNIAAVSERVEKAILSLMDNVGIAEKGAVHYGRTLTSLADELADTTGDGQGLIASVISETNRMAEINRALEGRLSQATAEVTQLRADLAKTTEEALTDGLTQVANRKAFDRAMTQHTLTAMAETQNLSLLILDIDFFKKFNDTHGHQTGDQVLRLVAKTIEQLVGTSGVAARMGGEEFGVLLPQTPLPKAVELAETIRARVGSKVLRNRKTNEELGAITLSIGAAAFTIGETIAEFVARADEALYLAKRSGRNRVSSERDLPPEMRASAP